MNVLKYVMAREILIRSLRPWYYANGTLEINVRNSFSTEECVLSEVGYRPVKKEVMDDSKIQ